MARQWAHRDGRNVALVLAARSVDKLEAVATECRRSGAAVLVQRCDVGVEADCRALVAATVGAFGRLDILVNNAGMSAHARFDAVADLGWYEALMRTNYWGSLWCTHAALPHLKSAHGRLIAVASLAGLIGVPERTAYSGTKFAMVGFFEALRAELAGSGISVTVAYPGVVATAIRYRGYAADGRPAGKSGLEESQAMSVQECARLIVEGSEARRRDIVMTAGGKAARWLKLIAPALVDRLATKALHRDRAS